MGAPLFTHQFDYFEFNKLGNFFKGSLPCDLKHLSYLTNGNPALSVDVLNDPHFVPFSLLAIELLFWK